ncbi:MAG TPA: DNA polymerase III, partial [Patescibacteria group bacterium]|nr:DNA polymerase III [Patescibacteria group bacterium]
FNLDNPKTVIKDVERLAKEGKIADIEGFGEKSQSDMMRAISEFGKGAGKTTRMLLPFAAELAENLVTYLKQSPAVVEAEPLGSLRRHKTTVGDVDIAVATENPKEVIEHFVAYPYKSRIIERGPATASLLTTGGQQVDLMTQPVASWGSLLQHFSGSKNHNVHLRDYALKKLHLSLSEYGIKNMETPSAPREQFKTEEAFYNRLGMDWIPPELREDVGEIEKALTHSLPKLVELKDILGDFHIHSSYPIEPSHDMGANSMQEMLTHAKSLGYEYLAFSEHNPSVSKHTKTQMYDILAKRQHYIEQLKESNKNIRVISLLETDILVNGDLAIDGKSLSLLDATIVSIHSSFGMDTQTMTKRVLAGLSHPKAKILAHPTGRLINERPGYNLDWEQIFAFCKANNKALEINCWPERSDLPDNLIRDAVNYGVKLAIDTDSHATAHMDYMYYGVWLARRGWAQKSDIINTLEYNKLIEWLGK